MLPDSAVLKIKGLEAKFDVIAVSNSLSFLLGSERQAKFIQQLHFFLSNEKNGVMLKNARWIYKSIKEWIHEVLPGWSTWKLRQTITDLLAKGILKREHLFAEHHGDNYHSKNRTYYYRLDYQRLDELAEEKLKSLDILKRSVLRDTTKQFCDCPQNRTKSTSTENNHIENTPPTPSNFSEPEKEIKTPEREIKADRFLNTNADLAYEDPWFTEPQENKSASVAPPLEKVRKVPRVVHKKDKKPHKPPKPHTHQRVQALKVDDKRAPWVSPEQLRLFYKALIKALPTVADARNADAVAKRIVTDLSQGIPNSYWEDFAAGDAIGTLTKPEWEAEPGRPFPEFVNYLSEKCKDAHDSAEKALEAAYDVLSHPKQAKGFWGRFKRSLINVSEQVKRDKALGVAYPNTPTWTREQIEPSIEEAAIASEEVKAVNESVTKSLPNSSPVKDEIKTLPVDVSALTKDLGNLDLNEAEASPNKESKPKPPKENYRANTRKNHVSNMTVEEVNECLKDPILKQEIMGQLLFSDRFDVEVDYLGQPLWVRLKKRGYD